MKKILFITLFMFFVTTTAIFGESMINIIVNGKAIDLKDSQPYINADSRTMVPIRFISENLGAAVKWDGVNKTVTVEAEGKDIKVVVNQRSAKLNNNEIKMDTEAVNKDGRVYVPLRAISELLGAEVGWDQNTKTVTITTGSKTIEQPKPQPVPVPIPQPVNDGIPEPNIDIITYYHDEWETKHFQIAIKNINDYSSDTQFRIVCTSHEELNSYEQPSWYVENKWYFYDKTEWINQSTIAEKEVPTIYSLSRSPYFVAQKYIKTFQLKDGITFEFKVYIKKGKVTKEYPIKVENFKYVERRKQ